MRHGFDLGYKTWVHHGEPDLPPPPPVRDNTIQPQMSDKTALLNDLSYIPPNNEQNEATQRDIGETSNKPTKATRNEFEELYASANEELYPGCDYVTRLDFMHICSVTLMEDDMLKAHIKVVDILCDLKLIYPHALFDIMIHLVIHLPLEALKGGPIRPRWMFPLERYMRKLKGYVRNKAKPEGSIAEGSVAEEAWTFSMSCTAVMKSRNSKQRHLFACPDGEMYYGKLQEILEFKYLLFKVVLFRVKWFNTRNQGRKVKHLFLRNNMTQIDTRDESFKDDQYILVTQFKQVFYLIDKAKPYWRVVEHVNHKKFSDKGVIMVEDDPDIIHFDNSSDLPLSTSLNDLDNATLHIDGQSMEVDVPPDIIDVVNDEDALPHDLADSDNEDLINVDDDVKAQHWVIDPTTGTYNMNKIRRARPENITANEWDKYIEFWNDPRNIARAAQNRGRPQPLKSTRRSLTSSLWHTLLTENSFGIRTDEEMRMLEATGTNTDDEINRLARGVTQSISQFGSGGASGSGGCGDEEEGADHQDDEDEDGDGDT
nr:hypothetical protein [Tanacetum cinerariifolium]